MKELFKKLNERPIVYYPVYSEITGSVKAGILLSQIMYWHKAMKEEPFYKVEKDWLQELAMNRKEFRNAKDILEKLELVSVSVEGNKRQTYYFPEVDKIVEMILSKVPKGNNGKCRNGILQSAETAQCTYTEMTTENTQRVADKSAASRELIQFMVEEYKKIKHFDEVKGWDKVNFPRHAKEATQIIEMLKANFTDMEDEETKKEILRCLKEFVQWEKKTNLTWQLSTVVKKFGEYMSDTLLTTK